MALTFSKFHVAYIANDRRIYFSCSDCFRVTLVSPQDILEQSKDKYGPNFTEKIENIVGKPSRSKNKNKQIGKSRLRIKIAGVFPPRGNTFYYILDRRTSIGSSIFFHSSTGYSSYRSTLILILILSILLKSYMTFSFLLDQNTKCNFFTL